ncbi:hypothetical protein [Mycolicibacterium sp. D5.8-2]|uniref:hypothetical protein n=1 Tax=Mycolicibacterium sp. D5.8-2 TaxID=3085903 RepID=UPI00298CBC1A|nr:hypothetical protein [Mycolicibacterium sp. D5.8-2]
MNTDGVGREVQRAVRNIRDIEIDVDANVRTASQHIGRWRKGEQSEAVDIDVDAQTKGAKTNVGRWRAAEQAKPIHIRVDADTGRARREVDALSSTLFKFGRSDVLKLNVGAAAITALPMLAAGLAEVAAGIQQVAQAGLALPGIMAGATASIGSLVFGLSGIGDAYDAMNKAADEAAKSGGDVAAQQRAQMSASFGLRNAIVDEADARKDVNRAIKDTQRDLQDLNLQMRGGAVSEKRAVRELQKARQRLYSGDFSDYQDALLDVEEAEIRVEEVRSRNARTAEELSEANANGVMGSDQVVAANERLIRSQQGVAQAEAAVAAAAPAATAAQENAALAMSKLAPEAQDFLNALMDVKGPFQTLRNLVQGNIFRGLDDQLINLSAKSMPMLEEGLGGLGDAWNKTFNEIFPVAGKDETQGIISRIFGNTEDAQNILTEAIEPLAEGLGVLSEAGSRALPRLADGFVKVSERFADFITEADESGKLDEWIGESITALGNLGETALNVGKMFTGITNAADGSFLEKLESWTNTWQEWLNSAEGQNTLRDIFAEGKRTFEQWRPILEDIPGLFKGIYDGASTWIGAVTKVLSPFTEILRDHPTLVKLAAEAYLVFKTAQVLSSFGGLLTMFGTTLPDAAGTSGDKAGKRFSSKFDAAVRGASWVTLGYFISEELESGFDDMFGSKTSETGLPGTLKWFINLAKDPSGTLAKTFPNFRNPFTLGDGPKPVGTNAAYGTPGQDALGAGFFTGTAVPGQSARDFAHTSMLPYWEGQGLTVGDHEADQYGEHQNGALDIMVPNIERGNQVLQEVLSDPNVYGAIFNGKSYGYGNGNSGRPYTGPNPHTDHVHVWYKPGGAGNISPPRAAPTPAGPGAPVMGPPLPAPPPPAPAGPLEELLGRVPKYDTGGPWPPGTLGINTTGKPEFVLNPEDIEYLRSQGIDPNSLQHGSTGGAPPGPVAHGTGAQPGPLPPGAPARTEGYIPAAAGNNQPVGQGGISNFLDLGESFFHNLIDTGAQLGSMAVSAAAAAGSFGAGAAAGPAASTAIQMGAEAAKRGVTYGYDMLGIWGEALVEQAFPFGAPRWLGSANPMAFMPQGLPMGEERKAPGTMGGARTAIQSWAQPGNPAMANMGTGSQGAQSALGLAKQQPSYQQAPQKAPQTPIQPTQQQAGFNPMDPSTWLQFGGVFDNGGVLPPKAFGMNLSTQPEYVFTQRQMSGMQKVAAGTVPSKGDTNNFYATDLNGTLRQWEHTKRRQSRRHSGRP